jgi:hypothetical protein
VQRQAEDTSYLFGVLSGLPEAPDRLEAIAAYIEAHPQKGSPAKAALLRDTAASLRPPEWQCVVCENRYPGRRPEDGICLTCADGQVHPLIGSTVVLADDDGPGAVTGEVTAVYPEDDTADVRWTPVGQPVLSGRLPLSDLRPFPARHLSAVGEATS